MADEWASKVDTNAVDPAFLASLAQGDHEAFMPDDMGSFKVQLDPIQGEYHKLLEVTAGKTWVSSKLSLHTTGSRRIYKPPKGALVVFYGNGNYHPGIEHASSDGVVATLRLEPSDRKGVPENFTDDYILSKLGLLKDAVRTEADIELAPYLKSLDKVFLPSEVHSEELVVQESPSPVARDTKPWIAALTKGGSVYIHRSAPVGNAASHLSDSSSDVYVLYVVSDAGKSAIPLRKKASEKTWAGTPLKISEYMVSAEKQQLLVLSKRNVRRIAYIVADILGAKVPYEDDVLAFRNSVTEPLPKLAIPTSLVTYNTFTPYRMPSQLGKNSVYVSHQDLAARLVEIDPSIKPGDRYRFAASPNALVAYHNYVSNISPGLEHEHQWIVPFISQNPAAESVMYRVPPASIEARHLPVFWRQVGAIERTDIQSRLTDPKYVRENVLTYTNKHVAWTGKSESRAYHERLVLSPDTAIIAGTDSVHDHLLGKNFKTTFVPVASVIYPAEFSAL